MNKVNSILAGVGVGIAALVAPVLAFAADPVPTLYPPDATASQLLVNGVGSVQSTLYSIAGLIWPYAIGVLLFFLVIRFGMSWFHRH